MKVERYEINCQKGDYSNYNISRTYKLVKVVFNRKVHEDRENLKHIYKMGLQLSDRVNPMAASDSSIERGEKRRKIDGVSGYLAEWCWKYFLNDYLGKRFVDITEFDSASSQIDLIINKNKKRIEVRSSNVWKGVKFGLCSRKKQFHVVGPYKNVVKPGEVHKHFYVMVLYPVEKRLFFNNFFEKEIVEVDLTCGTTWEMMNDKNIFEWKTLESKDYASDIVSEYRVIKFEKSLDTIDIANLINE